MQLNAFRVTALALALAGGLFASNDVAACTTDAWSSATGAPVAGSPAAVKRYTGLCGMQAALAGSSFVTDNSPNGTTDGTSNPYRARFYAFTGTSANSPLIFSATSGDGGAGTQAVGITRTGTGFSFSIPGTTVGNYVEAAGGAAFNNKWYMIEIFYQDGQPFTATVRGSNVGAETVLTSAGNVSGGVAVSSASLGVVNAAVATTALAFDDFESTRSAASRIGPVCRGDANNSGGVTASDRTAVTLELGLPPVLAQGQPDCNEDGQVTASDRFCITQKLAIFDPVTQCL